MKKESLTARRCKKQAQDSDFKRMLEMKQEEKKAWKEVRFLENADFIESFQSEQIQCKETHEKKSEVMCMQAEVQC